MPSNFPSTVDGISGIMPVGCKTVSVCFCALPWPHDLGQDKLAEAALPHCQCVRELVDPQIAARLLGKSYICIIRTKWSFGLRPLVQHPYMYQPYAALYIYMCNTDGMSDVYLLIYTQVSHNIINKSSQNHTNSICSGRSRLSDCFLWVFDRLTECCLMIF